MSYKLFFWMVGLIVLMIAVFVINFPVEGATLVMESQTAADSTLQAMIPTQSTETALPDLPVVMPSSTPISLPTFTPFPTDSVPMLTLREATNCRSGPGLAYEIIVTYPINQPLEILGRADSGDYWLVKSADSPTGNCWLWGEYADVAGGYSAPAIALVTIPPTPTAASLYAPSLQKYDYGCDDMNGTFSFRVLWEDRAGNETGYRIFRDGGLVAELPAGSTSFAETIGMPANRSAEYSVQAYNETGSASMPVKKLTCD